MKKRHRTSFVKPVAGPKSEINVTPLVDVVLVLLIIFMVVTPLSEKDLAVRIPTLETVQTTIDVPPDQIVVRVERTGAFTINGVATPASEYIDSLHKRLWPRTLVDRVVFVAPEDEAPYKKLVEALDGARSAGASTLGMAAEPSDANTATAPPPP